MFLTSIFLEWINIKFLTTTDELNENVTAYSNILVGFKTCSFFVVVCSVQQ